MWKKTVSAIAFGSILLAGCNMDKDVPNNNETPMEEVRDGANDITPDSTPDVNTPPATTDNNINNELNGDKNMQDQPNMQDDTVPNDSNTMNQNNADMNSGNVNK